MTTYFVSRHGGAIAWARRQALAVDVWVDHLDTSQLVPGDSVIGTLPIHLVADACGRGAAYLHLQFDLSAEQRGRELAADDLDALGACLVGYCVTRVNAAPLDSKEESHA